jgi:phosphatidylglycerophosphatase C
MKPSSNIVAAFDFDGTITTSDSLKAFVLHTVGPARFAAAGLRAAPRLLGMTARLCDRGVAKAAFLRHALRKMSPAELERASQDFCATRLARMVRPEMVERIRQHQALSHEVVLVSASPSLYLRIWAQSVGIGVVLSTELDIDRQGFTGRFIGRNCWGPEKVRRLEAWWNGSRPRMLFAYGDSRGDREMAAAADVAWVRGNGELPALDR